MSHVLVLSGPNLDLLGTREPEIYGRTTLAEIHDMLHALATERGSTIEARQSDHEGELADWVGGAPGTFDGILINPGALAHASIVLRDAIAACGLPAVEVHISNVFAREPWRHKLVMAPAARGVILGLGTASYRLGLVALLEIIASENRRD